MTRYLTGGAPCEIVDIGYTRRCDLAPEVPPRPLGVVMSTNQSVQVYGRLAEPAARHLGELRVHWRGLDPPVPVSRNHWGRFWGMRVRRPDGGQHRAFKRSTKRTQ